MMCIASVIINTGKRPVLKISTQQVRPNRIRVVNQGLPAFIGVVGILQRIQAGGIQGSDTRLTIKGGIFIGPASPHIVGGQEDDEIQNLAAIGCFAEANLDRYGRIRGIDDADKRLPATVDGVILKDTSITQAVVVIQFHRHCGAACCGYPHTQR